MTLAVKLVDTGRGSHLVRLGVPPWIVRLFALYQDVRLESGALLPWSPGTTTILEQPAREVQVLRLIRSEREKRRKEKRKREDLKRGFGGGRSG